MNNKTKKNKIQVKIISGHHKNTTGELISINKKKQYVKVKGINLKMRFIPILNKKQKYVKKKIFVEGKIHLSNICFIFNKT